VLFSALANAQGDFPAAENFLKESISLYEELGDDWGIAATLNALAVAAPRPRRLLLSGKQF
jgi:hypothetical protein